MMLLTAAAAGMVAIGRTAWHQTARAVQARQELQARWGMISLERAVASHLGSLGETLDESAGVVDRELELGSMRVRMVLSDENVKLNVRQLWGQTASDSRSFGEQIAQWLAMGDKPAAQLLPPRGASPDWAEWMERDVAPRGLDALLTTHGDGRLNIRRCDENKLRIRLRAGTSRAVASAFLRQWQRDPRRPVAEIATALTLPEADVKRLKDLLRDDSGCLLLTMTADQSRHLGLRRTIWRLDESSDPEVLRWQ